MKKLFYSLLAGLSSIFFTAMASAAEEVATSGGEGYKSALAIGTGIVIGIAALGGTLAQGRAASSALEGIARNPSAANKIQTPMILGLALIESLVILAWVIAFLLQGKI